MMGLPMYVTGYERQVARISDDDVRKRYGVQTVHRLSQNENPLGPAPDVIATIQQLTPTLARYPDYSDIALREALIEVIGRGLTVDYLYTGMSGYESLELVTRGFLRPDDEVIVSSPTFISAYQKTSVLQGARVVDVPLHPQTFVYDVEGVLNAITPRTRLILLCNPNNPTGTIITDAQMAHLLGAIPDHVLVVADQVYEHYVTRPDFPDALPYVLNDANLVLTYSFSKAYGLAGLRLGFGIAPPRIADYLASMHRGFHHSTLTLGAGVVAVRNQAYLQQVIDFTHRERALLEQAFAQLGVRYWTSQANFVLFETAYPATDLTELFMQVGILVRPQHKSGLAHAVRVSVGTTEANRAFITRLSELV
ncbi:MAG: pyridoxal phosphate-dependent aminotransferase [Anaerolineae bacterium]